MYVFIFLILFLSFFLIFLVMSLLFFFNDPASTEIYPLSLHDALPIYMRCRASAVWREGMTQSGPAANGGPDLHRHGDRKSTRLNSSHTVISYAVFCLKKKKKYKSWKRII